jgi:hypothetical protein
MKRFFLFLLLFFLVLNACRKDELKIDPNNLLIGVWNYVEYQQYTAVYARQQAFTQNPGYNFKADGTLTERKNAGWCGTPPVSYADYPGTWTITNDTMLRIDDSYWGGTTGYTLIIESVTRDSLKVNMVYELKK